MVYDNNFNRDSHSTRTERLRIIQYNFASIQPILAAPSHIEAWATDCYDIYVQLRTEAGVESAVKTGKTMLATSKNKLMEKEYQFARVFGKSMYADNSPILKEQDKQGSESRKDVENLLFLCAKLVEK
jgi:hypothetical protein